MARVTLGELADAYGSLKMQREELEKKLHELEREIVRRNVDEIEGVRYEVTLHVHTTGRFIVERGRKYLSTYQIRKCMVYDQETRFKVKDKHAEGTEREEA